jgi:hypothetical protein
MLDAPVLFLENVRGILKLGMDSIVNELSRKRGYELRWCVVSASDVGAPHVRPRWFCLAVRPGFTARLPPQDVDAADSRVWSSWSHHRPPPRALTPGREAVGGDLRMGLMGNSVVPAAVRHACMYLASRGAFTPCDLLRWPTFTSAQPITDSTMAFLPGRRWPSSGLLPPTTQYCFV